MRVPKWEEYLGQVLSHVKFKYDHAAIYSELKDHMQDRYEEFLEEGMEQEGALQAVLTNMGDAHTIGEELNQVHSPFLGWIWRSLRMVLIVLVVANIVPVFVLGVSGFISLFDRYEKKTDSPLVYCIDLDYKEKVYDTTLIIDEILYYEDQTLEVRYATWVNPFSDSIKWTSSIAIQAYAGEEELERNMSGWQGGGYYGRGQTMLSNISSNATKLIIRFGQDIEIPVDLTEGRVMANES